MESLIFGTVFFVSFIVILCTCVFKVIYNLLIKNRKIKITLLNVTFIIILSTVTIYMLAMVYFWIIESFH